MLWKHTQTSVVTGIIVIGAVVVMFVFVIGGAVGMGWSHMSRRDATIIYIVDNIM